VTAFLITSSEGSTDGEGSGVGGLTIEMRLGGVEGGTTVTAGDVEAVVIGGEVSEQDRITPKIPPAPKRAARIAAIPCNQPPEPLLPWGDLISYVHFNFI